MRFSRFLVCATLTASLLLAGCGQQAPSVVESTPAPTPTATPAPTPIPTVDIATKGGYPEVGDVLGSISIPGTEVDCTLYWGDAPTQLDQGAGIYPEAKMPGQPGTILVAAHTHTYFADLKSIEVGDEIVIITYYGDYRYRIVDAQVAQETDTSAYDLTKEEQNIILYTCYPFGTLSRTTQRYFVYGEYVDGPDVIDSSAQSASENSASA